MKNPLDPAVKMALCALTEANIKDIEAEIRKKSESARGLLEVALKTGVYTEAAAFAAKAAQEFAQMHSLSLQRVYELGRLKTLITE